MKLEELKAALESDATKENTQLKEELARTKTRLAKTIYDFETEIKSLQDDCKALANRCWVLSKGMMCIFCQLSQFDCPHKSRLSFMNDRKG